MLFINNTIDAGKGKKKNDANVIVIQLKLLYTLTKTTEHTLNIIFDLIL